MQEFKRIYKGQKSITKGFLENNATFFARKDENFWVVFKHCMYCVKVNMEQLQVRVFFFS